MNDAEVTNALQPWIESMGRAAWRPTVAAGEDASTMSRFGGPSWLYPTETVPLCGQCRRPLQQFLQLDLDLLPAGFSATNGGGLLQFFYCLGTETCDTGVPLDAALTDFPDCSGDYAYEPFSPNSLVRVVESAAVAPRGIPGLGQGQFGSAVIVDWEPFVDLPDPEDHPAFGLSCTINDYDDFNERAVPYSMLDQRVTCSSVGLETVASHAFHLSQVCRAADGDKLAGWPRWIQGAERPECPLCGQQMEVLFQVDSEDHVPFMFGDAGIGHITQCSQHPKIVTFAWACS